MPTNLLKKNKIAQVCGINFQGRKKGCFQEHLMQSKVSLHCQFKRRICLRKSEAKAATKERERLQNQISLKSFLAAHARPCCKMRHSYSHLFSLEFPCLFLCVY